MHSNRSLRKLQFLCNLLPPATKLGQGNIFRSVCQEFCPQSGGYMTGGAMCGKGGMHVRGHVWQGGPVWWGACEARGVHSRGHVWQGACIAEGHAWQGGMHGGGACMAWGGMPGIRSISGWYAYYWNAFLLFYFVGSWPMFKIAQWFPDTKICFGLFCWKHL